jgi:high affinity choline transporter 7
MLLGLAAIVGAVTSSFSSSILSAGGMFAWNIGDRLIFPNMGARRLQAMIRASILGLGVAAVVLALNVRSVAALWLFTGDLVFVLLFPQLLLAMFDPRANRVGSVSGLVVALAIRLAGGVSLATDQGMIGFPELVPLSATVARLFGADPTAWVDAAGASLLPIRTIAAAAGLVSMWTMSRLTAGFDPPTPLPRAPAEALPEA